MKRALKNITAGAVLSAALFSSGCRGGRPAADRFVIRPAPPGETTILTIPKVELARVISILNSLAGEYQLTCTLPGDAPDTVVYSDDTGKAVVIAVYESEGTIYVDLSCPPERSADPSTYLELKDTLFSRLKQIFAERVSVTTFDR